MSLTFGSVCSGIEAASVAWKPLGWRCAFMSEIEAFPRAVLAHHYPETPLHGDFTTIRAGEYEPIDVLVGGTPCQSFSVAGLRGGLDDDRGNLALEYLTLADRLRPRWLVWENVPGVLSSNGGRDFGAILGGMVELGYGVAYRVLDAQFFGVAQRRRRVFVVGYAGDWRRAAAVLFERHSLQGHPAPRREKGKAAPTIPSHSSAGGGLGTDFDCDGGLIASTGETSHCLNAGGMGRQDYETKTLIAHAIQERAVCENPDAGPDGAGFRSDDAAYTIEARSVPQAVAFNITPSNSNMDYKARQSDRAQAITAGGNRPSARGGDLIAFGWQNSASQGDGVGDVVATLDKSKTPAVAFDLAQITSAANRTRVEPGLPASTLNAAGQMHVATSAVRRLTPRECERLQGFPDDYTLVPHRGKPAADGPRYKALGNSMAVPVMRWIGERIATVEALALSPTPTKEPQGEAA